MAPKSGGPPTQSFWVALQLQRRTDNTRTDNIEGGGIPPKLSVQVLSVRRCDFLAKKQRVKAQLKSI